MFYLGIDVSKAKLDCCLLMDADSTKRKSKSITNNKAGVAELLIWLAKQGVAPACLHATMEATGVYHEQAALALHEAGVTVSIANPAQVKDFGKGLAVRTKTDGSDSVVLARYGALVKPRTWQPPSPQARTLKALLARRDAIAHDLQRELNRLEKAQATETPALILKSLKASIKFLQKQLQQLQKQIDDHINGHPELKEDMDLLTSISAVGPRLGSEVLSVTSCSTFHSAEQLAAFIGQVPVEHQSGTSVQGRAHLSKAGPPHIRAVLYMAAISGIRYNPHVKAVYERMLAKGKSKMSALGAAMRKLIHLCFGVLKTRKPYDPNYAKAT